MGMLIVYLVVGQLAIFGLIVMAIKQILLRDTMKAVTRLRDAEGELAKKEDTIRKRIEDNENEFRRKNAEAQDALVRGREAMEKELARTRETLVEEAKKERDRILDEATRNKEKLRMELVREMETRTMEYAGKVYELVFSEDLGSRLDNACIEELLIALGEMDASSITVQADAVGVECSRPLDAAHKQKLQEIIEQKFSTSLSVRETIVPDLVAGIRIKLGSLEIDGSLQNRFREAIQQLKRDQV